MFVVFGLVAFSLPALLKTPWTPDDDVEGRLNEMEAAVVAGRWETAGDDLERLQGAWHRMRGRVLVNSDPSDIRDFEDALSTLAVAMAEEERLEARLGVALMRQVWTDVGGY